MAGGALTLDGVGVKRQRDAHRLRQPHLRLRARHEPRRVAHLALAALQCRGAGRYLVLPSTRTSTRAHQSRESKLTQPVSMVGARRRRLMMMPTTTRPLTGAGGDGDAQSAQRGLLEHSDKRQTRVEDSDKRQTRVEDRPEGAPATWAAWRGGTAPAGTRCRTAPRGRAASPR
jgi:hypothetical protein